MKSAFDCVAAVFFLRVICCRVESSYSRHTYDERRTLYRLRIKATLSFDSFIDYYSSRDNLSSCSIQPSLNRRSSCLSRMASVIKLQWSRLFQPPLSSCNVVLFNSVETCAAERADRSSGKLGLVNARLEKLVVLTRDWLVNQGKGSKIDGLFSYLHSTKHTHSPIV